MINYIGEVKREGNNKEILKVSLKKNVVII